MTGSAGQKPVCSTLQPEQRRACRGLVLGGALSDGLGAFFGLMWQVSLKVRHLTYSFLRATMSDRTICDASIWGFEGLRRVVITGLVSSRYGFRFGSVCHVGKPALNPRLLTLSSEQQAYSDFRTSTGHMVSVRYSRCWFSMKVEENVITDGCSLMEVQNSETGS